MSDYFDPLIDTVPLEIIQAAHEAMTQHIHHGAGNQDESTLLHGVRALIKAVRADEAARNSEHYDKWLEFNEQANARREQENRDWLRSVDHQIKDSVADRDRVFQILLTARRKGRKTLPLAELLEALRMEAWS